MEEQHHYELRSKSRSRSHTPMIFNQADGGETIASEYHYDLRERSSTPSIDMSYNRPSSVSKSKKSKENLMETITEIKDSVVIEAEKNQSEIVEKTKKVERRSERQRVKRQMKLSNGQNDEIDNISINSTKEKRKSVTPKRTITSDYSSEEGEREDPPSRPGSAYEIYKQAGDWWNVFPKTDYTYSLASQCRYEIAPGILAMPNMSRPSIHSDGSSISSSRSLSQQNLSQSYHSSQEYHNDLLDKDLNESIEQNRINEENAALFSSHTTNKLTHQQIYEDRYTHYFESNISRNRFGNPSSTNLDSDLDEAVTMERSFHHYNQQWKITKWVKNISHSIFLLFYSIMEFINVKILRKNRVTSHKYYQYQDPLWMKGWYKLNTLFKYLYLLLIKILFLDSWLLSRAFETRKRLVSRRSLIFWFILIPPLLLAGFWLLPYLPNVTMASFNNIFTKNGHKQSLDLFNNNLNEEQSKKDDNKEIIELMTVIIKRIDKLEAIKLNDEEQYNNVTESIKQLKENNKNFEFNYKNKLTDLESKLVNNEADRTMHNELENIKLEFNNLRKLYEEVKTCCDKNIITLMNNNFKSQVEQVISNYIGPGITKGQLNTVINNMLLTESSDKNNLDEKCSNNNILKLTEENMRKIVIDILKIYDADKTGLVDYALESAGGQIISIRCTQSYNVNTRAFKVLGFTLFYESGDPRTVIQGHSLQPGICWAFQDFPGFLLIKLRSCIKITGFTLEHVHKSILPNNEMKSAPRKFNVYGLKEENDDDAILFGEYEFLDNNESLQYFPVQNHDINDYFEYVELRIDSNHGQLEYTCLYRFRVHGIPR